MDGMGILQSKITSNTQSYEHILVKSNTKAKMINVKSVLLEHNIKTKSFDELINVLINEFKENNKEVFTNG